MIVGLLLVAALLVDRFVLLPAFEDGQGSTGVAVAAWLAVNLLPAFAWLALNARNPEHTRGQLFAGTLAVATTTAVLIVPVLIWWTARDEAPEAPTAAAVAMSPPSSEAHAIADRCGWGVGRGREAAADAVSSTFVDAAPGFSVGLLMEGTSFRPGDSFATAVRNDSGAQVRYGAQTGIENAETGQEVPIGVDMMYPLIGLTAGSGEIGPCVTVHIPSGAEPGMYRAFLSASGPTSNRTLEGGFQVAGEPVRHGWEEEFAEAQKRVEKLENSK